MRLICLFMLLVSFSANAEDMKSIKSIDASVLAFIDELSNRNGIIVYSAPIAEGECWGTVDSCPDVQLFVVVTPQALYQDPQVFQLPSSKGWEFIRWNENNSFTVKTSIPSNNIEPKERNKWTEIEYTVSVRDGTLTYK